MLNLLRRLLGGGEFYDPTEDLSDESLAVETDDQRMPWHDSDDGEEE